MENNNEVVQLIQTQCRRFPRGRGRKSPEGFMYGIANLITMKPDILDLLLEQNKYSKKETLPAELRKASELVKKAGLDPELIKKGTSVVLLVENEERCTDFYNGLLELEEPVYFHTVVEYVLSQISREYLAAFSVNSNIDKVFAYRDFIRETAEIDSQFQKIQRGEEPDFSKITPPRRPEDIKESQESQKNQESQEEDVGELELRLARRLAGASIGGKEIEGIISRIDGFAEMVGEESQKSVVELCKELLEIDGLDKVQRAHSEYKNKDSNQNYAKFCAEVHSVIRNIVNIIEQKKEEFINSDNRFLYLSQKYSKVYQSLTEKVIGQDFAVNEFVQACFNAELYENDPKHPQAAFLFAGPPGVGKTYLAGNVAEMLNRPFKTFDMAAYSVEKSDLLLVGVEQGFKNASEGTLVSFVENNPDAIILFDEIEKAHPDVTRLFLSVLEGARLENKFLEKNTDFSKTILIFTTNAGRAIYENNKKNLSATPTDLIIRELRKEKDSDTGLSKFPAELCSRFASQHIVMFNNISFSDMTKLVVNHMDEACKDIEQSLNVSIDYDKRLALLLLMHFGDIDVRVVTGKAQQFIKKEIYELSRQLVNAKELNSISRIRFSIDDSRITDKAKDFFSTVALSDAIVAVACDEKSREKITKANNGAVKIRFIASEEELIECDPDDITYFLVDPYYQMQKVDDRILGLDDYDSVGLRIIKNLLQDNNQAPVFILEAEKKVSATDKNSLYMRGVENTISLLKDNYSEVIEHIAAEQFLQKKCTAMLNRRKVFDFESLQEMPDEDGVVQVKFYDITVKDAVTPEDQDILLDIEERPNVKFDDVIGSENAKAELRDFVRYLDNPKSYMKNALAVPKGVLLYGPPGTGKTMLAKAMAGETDATFISVSAAKLRSTGENGIERLFTTARKYAPAIIFLDEVDAIARKRTGSALSSSYEESLLNMLLTQMDGFEQHKGAPVFVIAATNFGIEESDDPMSRGLDPAFMRRFGNKILIGQPNKDEKMQFLSRRLKISGKSVLNNTVTEEGIRNVAERTPGESLATIENILEFAFRNAARKNQQLDNELLDEAMEEYFYGEKRERDEDQAYRTAIHEASHAYIYSLSGKKPAYITVISRGNFGGYMQREDEENKGTMSKEECIWSIRTNLAGRVGEKVIFGDADALNTGASSDLRHASSLALAMLTTYGMDEEHLFSMPYEHLLQANLMPSYVQRAEEILKQEEKECAALIEKGKDKVVALAKALMEKNHLNQEEILEIIS